MTDPDISDLPADESYRYGVLMVEGAETIIYDTESRDAWIQSSVAAPVASRR